SEAFFARSAVTDSIAGNAEKAIGAIHIGGDPHDLLGLAKRGSACQENTYPYSKSAEMSLFERDFSVPDFWDRLFRGYGRRSTRAPAEMEKVKAQRIQ